MIIVLSPVGGFNSTIEYCIRQFSNELTKVPAVVLDTGSMHSYRKEFHPITIDLFFKNSHDKHEIATPIYPGNDYLSPIDTVMKFKENLDPAQKVLIVHFDTEQLAEQNQLFSYHKLPNLLPDVLKDKHKVWDSTYDSLEDMQPFEIREALSFFIDQQLAHLEVHKIINNHWLSITPNDLLYNFKNTILKIIDYFELTVNPDARIEEFYAHWISKQRYIITEFEKINNITDNIILDHPMSWTKLSILGEAIIQSRLRRRGIDLACHNLNDFPTDIASLKNSLLYPTENI